MKKINFLFIFLTCFYTEIVAQIPTLCNYLGSLMEESHTNFANITGDNLESGGKYQRKASTITLMDASLCYIEVNGEQTFWYAEYKTFNTLQEAKTKIMLIQSEFISCAPNAEFVVNPRTDFSSSYFLKENVTGGFIYYKIELSICQNGENKYIPVLMIPQNASPITFVKISNDEDTSVFARDIKSVLSESITAFQNIRGGEVSSDVFATTYSSNFCLNSALGCEITESIAGKYYDAFYGTNLAAAAADKLLQQLEGVAVYALGNKYVWQNLENGIGFTELAKAGKNSIPVIEVNKEKVSDDSFDVVIHIRQQ